MLVRKTGQSLSYTRVKISVAPFFAGWCNSRFSSAIPMLFTIYVYKVSKFVLYKIKIYGYFDSRRFY